MTDLWGGEIQPVGYAGARKIEKPHALPMNKK
jgi:hypothetical protein